jgi:hypothetical protein
MSRFLRTNTSQVGRFQLSKTFSSAVELNSDGHTQKNRPEGAGEVAAWSEGWMRRYTNPALAHFLGAAPDEWSAGAVRSSRGLSRPRRDKP